MEVPVDGSLVEASVANANNTNSNEEDDDFDIAFAAEAAANAVEAADAEQQRLDEQLLSCRICGQGSEEGRPILRFRPVGHDSAAAAAAPSVSSFTQDIALHIFCGKTASILPSVNKPELEVLTKAGLKNKHGIGPEVNAALARTRCATLNQDGAKEKQFYLVREFEAHLAAIRHTHISFVSDASTALPGVPSATSSLSHATSYSPQTPQGLGTGREPTHLIPPNKNTNTSTNPHTTLLGIPPTTHMPQVSLNHNYTQPRLPQHSRSSKSKKHIPARAGARAIQKPGLRQHHQLELTEEGKVRCDCGGTHWPIGTPRGASSWRNHVMTKRHQKWMESNGLLGIV